MLHQFTRAWCEKEFTLHKTKSGKKLTDADYAIDFVSDLLDHLYGIIAI